MLPWTVYAPGESSLRPMRGARFRCHEQRFSTQPPYHAHTPGLAQKQLVTSHLTLSYGELLFAGLKRNQGLKESLRSQNFQGSISVPVWAPRGMERNMRKTTESLHSPSKPALIDACSGAADASRVRGGTDQEASLVPLHPAPQQGLQVGAQLLLPQQLHLVLLTACHVVPAPAGTHSLTSLAWQVLYCAQAL